MVWNSAAPLSNDRGHFCPPLPRTWYRTQLNRVDLPGLQADRLSQSHKARKKLPIHPRPILDPAVPCKCKVVPRRNTPNQKSAFGVGLGRSICILIRSSLLIPGHQGNDSKPDRTLQSVNHIAFQAR